MTNESSHFRDQFIFSILSLLEKFDYFQSHTESGSEKFKNEVNVIDDISCKSLNL